MRYSLFLYLASQLRAFLGLSILLSLALSSLGQSDVFSHPIKYNNYIVAEQNLVIVRNLDYLSHSVHSEDINSIEKKRIEVIKQLLISSQKVSDMPPYKGDSDMRDDAYKVLMTYLEAFKVDFNEALALKQKSQESYEAMEQYFKAQDFAEKKLQQATKHFDKAQQSFAKKYEIEIVAGDASLSNKLDRISEVNEYSRKIFLEYFKVSKQNAGFLDAIQDENANEVEKCRRLLLKTSSESVQKISAIGAFYDDASYQDATLTLINFLKRMASREFIDVVKFMRLNERVDQLKTQAEITEYNQLVESFNTIISHYNTESERLVHAFNQSNRSLLQKNIPDLTEKKKVEGDRI